MSAAARIVEAGNQVSLEARGIMARRGGRDVLRGVDVTLRRGETVALLGPNGAGKTTLLEILGGLGPADAGSIQVKGRVAAALQAPALARRTALRNVELALSWWGVPGQQRRERALAALRSLGAEALADRPAGTLSGGEARRVHIARAVAVDPDILLLDEPFAGLDPGTRADLLYDTASVVRSPERASLVIVHDRAEAWALADHVLVMLAGRIEASGAPADVFGSPPTPSVASFLGYTGWIPDPSSGGIRMLRPADVRLDPAGHVVGTVLRSVPQEDGVRLEIAAGPGRLAAVAPAPGPQLGEEVRLRIEGGAVFPNTEPGEPNGGSIGS